MNKLLIVLLLVSCISCISDGSTSKTLTIHASSEIGDITMFVVAAGNGVATDSLSLELPQDKTKITYNWKPKLGEGSFVFSVVGRQELIDTVGYYTNGVLIGSPEYTITVYQDSLHLVDVFQ